MPSQTLVGVRGTNGELPLRLDRHMEQGIHGNNLPISSLTTAKKEPFSFRVPHYVGATGRSPLQIDSDSEHELPDGNSPTNILMGSKK
jgi:hypothetical protein